MAVEAWLNAKTMLYGTDRTDGTDTFGQKVNR